jgi:phosphate transport system permease protein
MFAGTELAALFPLVEHNLESMLRPRQTVYLRYFIDGSTIGGLFGGVGPELLGTLLLTVLTMLLALPVGVITAAYLVECTREGLLIRFIRTCINTLAGVPSIVFGLFGLAFFVIFAPDLANSVLAGLGVSLRLPGNRTILYGALTLAVLVLPIIIRASEEAIKAVPHSYKEAALSLGAGGFRTFVSVTLPAALPGILTGVILSMSRAAGETAPILFTAAVAFGAVPHSVLEPTRALPYSAYVFATGDDLAPKAPHNQYGMIMSLVLLVLVLNVAAILIRSRVARKLRGQ